MVVFENTTFEQGAETSGGVPTWPFYGRAYRHKEQHVRGPKQKHACVEWTVYRPEWLDLRGTQKPG